MKLAAAGFLLLLWVAGRDAVADVVVLSWTPRNDAKVGQVLHAGETMMIPKGQVVTLASDDYQLLTLIGVTTFHVPSTQEARLVPALLSALRRFGGILSLRSGAADPMPADLWSLDPHQGGPHCLRVAQPPAIWSAAGSASRDYEVTNKARQTVGYVKNTGDGGSTAWPASVPFEPDAAYVFKDPYDNTSVERTFHVLTESPTSEKEVLLKLLDAGCIAQARVALSELTKRTVGPDSK